MDDGASSDISSSIAVPEQDLLRFRAGCLFRFTELIHGIVCCAADLSEELTERAYVNVLTRGDLSSLRWIASPPSHSAKSNPNMQQCRVYYSSLNFRDIMLATGKLPPDAIPGL